MYDESFAYRFCYQLRGYVNHRNLPLEILHTDLITDEVQLFLNVHKLLKSSYNWNSKVKQELNGFESMSIKTILLELYAKYFDYYESMQNLFKNEIMSYTQVFDEINFKYNHFHSYSLKAYWDEAENNEPDTIIPNSEDLGSLIKKNNYNMIEFNLNLAQLEIIKGRLGFAIAPQHFTRFYSAMKQKL